METKTLTKEETLLAESLVNKYTALWFYLHKAEQMVVNDTEFKSLSDSLNLEMDKIQVMLESLEETFVVEG